jgi:hypothetical protein
VEETAPALRIGLTKGSRRPAEPIRRGAGFFSATDGPAAVSIGLVAGPGGLVAVLFVLFLDALDAPTAPDFEGVLGFTGRTLIGGAALWAAAVAGFAVTGFAVTDFALAGFAVTGFAIKAFCPLFSGRTPAFTGAFFTLTIGWAFTGTAFCEA